MYEGVVRHCFFWSCGGRVWRLLSRPGDCWNNYRTTWKRSRRAGNGDEGLFWDLMIVIRRSGNKKEVGGLSGVEMKKHRYSVQGSNDLTGTRLGSHHWKVEYVK